MKILSFVDLHGSAKALDKIKKKAKRADIVVCAGDTTIFENHLDKILSKLNKLKKTVLVIPGNHEDDSDLKGLVNKLDNVIDIDKKHFVKDDYLFFGYGGGGFDMVDDDFRKLSKRFEKIIKKNKDKKIILVTHAPPYKTKLDKIMKESCGNKAIRNFIKKVKPELAVSGHLHENAGKEDKIGKTKLINPGPYGKIITV